MRTRVFVIIVFPTTSLGAWSSAPGERSSRQGSLETSLSRGRDDYVMRSPAPSLEDVWTERIFAAFNRNRENSVVNSSDNPEASHSTGIYLESEKAYCDLL